MKLTSLTATAGALLFASTITLAAPAMDVQVKAWKDIVTVEDGKQVKKRVEANSQAAGETVIYTINYRNTGDEVATGVKIDNAIPEGTRYVVDTATGEGEVLFSIDNGKTYETRDQNGKSTLMKASPESYTNIRWLIPDVAPGKGGTAGYHVKVQ
jgi:uncharacterized repeat protein (TIGR01451 family)